MLLFWVSKSLNYIDSPVVGLSFSTFICTWVYLRHYLNLRIIFSLFTEFRTVGPYELGWDTQQYKCLYSNGVTFVLAYASDPQHLLAVPPSAQCISVRRAR